MVEYLQSKGIISSEAVIRAFQAIDRGNFLESEEANVYLNSTPPSTHTGLALSALSRTSD